MNADLIEAAHVRRAAAVVGLELAPAHLPGVLAYYRMTAALAAAVNEFPLTEDAESAAVFVPCSPPTAE